MEKIVDKVIVFLRNNPTATVKDAQKRISEKYGKNLAIRKFLEIKRVELIKKRKYKEANEIEAFLIRGIDDKDDKRILEEIISEIRGNDNDEERD